MPLPPVARTKTQNNPTSHREMPLPLLALQARWPRLLPLAAAGLALVIGFGIGVLVMRHRHQAEQVVASVNGVVITRDMLDARLQETAGQQVMHIMVEEQLRLQFAKSKNLYPTDQQVEERYQQASKDPHFASLLAASGMPVSDYKDSLRVKLAQAAVLTQGVTVSDADIRKYYQAQSNPRNPTAQFYKPDTITLRVIAAVVDPKKPDAAKKLVQSAMQELNSGTPFDLAASEYSQDASKSNGGLISPLQRGRSPITPDLPLETSLFNLKVNQLYGPVLFHNEWWIFRCEDKKQGQAVPFNTVKDEAALGAKLAKGFQQNTKRVETEFAAFEQNSKLQAFWPQYQRAVTGR